MNAGAGIHPRSILTEGKTSLRRNWAALHLLPQATEMNGNNIFLSEMVMDKITVFTFFEKRIHSDCYV